MTFCFDRIVISIEQSKTLNDICKSYAGIFMRIFNILSETLQCFFIHSESVIFNYHFESVIHALDGNINETRVHLAFQPMKYRIFNKRLQEKSYHRLIKHFLGNPCLYHYLTHKAVFDDPCELVYAVVIICASGYARFILYSISA